MNIAFIDFQNLWKSIDTNLYKYYINITGRPYPAKRICDEFSKNRLITEWKQKESDFTLVHTAWKMDFLKFREYLRQKFSIDRAIIFIWYISENETFYTRLRDFGFEIIFKQTLIQWEVIKGNVDAELVMHASLMIHEYDGAVLVTGDGDFLCLVEELIQRSKLIRILTPNNQTFSQLYKPYLSYILPLTKVREKLEHKKNEHRLESVARDL